jgi:hypothetical protein
MLRIPKPRSPPKAEAELTERPAPYPPVLSPATGISFEFIWFSVGCHEHCGGIAGHEPAASN